MQNINWLEIIPLAISILSFLGVGVIINNYWKERIEKKKRNTAEEQAKRKAERQAEIQEAVSNEINPIKNSISNIEGHLKDNNEGTVTLLRDRMKYALDECRIKGYASTSDKANFNEIYAAYAHLGGNHFKEYVDQWKLEMNSFPSETDKRK